MQIENEGHELLLNLSWSGEEDSLELRHILFWKVNL